MCVKSGTRRLCGGVVLLVAALAAPAAAYTPGSGDVDEDGRLTTRDALLIAESLTWPERARLFAFLDACDINRDTVCDTADVNAVLQATITNPSDWDGDEVPNASDCAPLDPRLATPHTYYLDLDRDQRGDSGQPVPLCTVVPEPPLALWRGDPSDQSPYPAPAIRPKGARVLSIDFAETPQDGQIRLDLVKELGADATTLRLPWSMLESTPGTYTAALTETLHYASELTIAHGLAVSLSISPISGPSLTVPDDLEAPIEAGTLRLNAPAVIDRFKALLTAAHARIGATSLVSLQIGHEIDEFLVRAPAHFWDDYAAFLQAVVPHAKQLWGAQLKVGTTATLVGLVTEPTATRLRAINDATDIVSLTYLPHGQDFVATEPADVFVHLASVIARYYPKPLYIQAAGFPTAPIAGSSHTKQSQFLTALFEVWDTWPELIPFVSIHRLNDVSRERAQWDAAWLGSSSPATPGYLETLGLRTFAGAGNAKTAYHTLRTLTMNRGWWRQPLPAARTYAMGFTPSPFEYPDEGDYQEMLAWLWGKITTDGDLVNLHLDSGVPWAEALTDTFASPELPYSTALRTRWTELKTHLPAGHKRLVSLNPLGIPRSVIAPYFGFGQGFTYDDQFRRVPNGVFEDTDNRMPPAPWDTYRLNHPNVKTAFVNYCKRAIDFFDPDYLIVAVETTATMLEGPAAYDEFLELQRHVYQTLKADPQYASVPLLVSVSLTSFVTDEFGVLLKFEEQSNRKHLLQVQGLLDVLPYVDMAAVSLYPHYGKYNSSILLAPMYEKLLGLLARAGKPVGISEAGFVAESFDLLGFPFVSDEQKQDLFYRHLFYELGKGPTAAKFITNFQVRDNDRIWERLRDGSLQNPPTVSPTFVEFYKYFRDIGIYDGNGGSRLSTQTWREMVARPLVP